MNQNFYDKHNGNAIKKVYDIGERKFSGIRFCPDRKVYDLYKNDKLVKKNVSAIKYLMLNN